MPNYDYSCTECGYTLEVFQKISETPLSKCPVCEKQGLQRGIGGGSATFRFKGDGFYITDYKKECVDKSSCPCSAPSDKYS